MGNITIYRGDDETYTITIKDSAGTAVDITGYTIFFTVKKTDTSISDGDALISKTVTSHSDPTNGVTTVTLTDADTDLPAGEYVYDIQWKDAGGLITTVGKWTFTVVNDVTRRIA